MKTITVEQAENEAARNWCAGLLSGAGARIEGDVAKRWVDIGVGILLITNEYEETSDEYDEMSYDEKTHRCDEAYDNSVASPDSPCPSICIVDGEEYTLCRDCPLWVE